MHIEETTFLSTFKVALVLVHLHLLVLGHVTLCHVTALVQIRWPSKYIDTIVLIHLLNELSTY